MASCPVEEAAGLSSQPAANFLSTPVVGNQFSIVERAKRVCQSLYSTVTCLH